MDDMSGQLQQSLCYKLFLAKGSPHCALAETDKACTLQILHWQTSQSCQHVSAWVKHVTCPAGHAVSPAKNVA